MTPQHLCRPYYLVHPSPWCLCPHCHRRQFPLALHRPPLLLRRLLHSHVRPLSSCLCRCAPLHRCTLTVAPQALVLLPTAPMPVPKGAVDIAPVVNQHSMTTRAKHGFGVPAVYHAASLSPVPKTSRSVHRSKVARRDDG